MDSTLGKKTAVMSTNVVETGASLGPQGDRSTLDSGLRLPEETLVETRGKGQKTQVSGKTSSHDAE